MKMIHMKGIKIQRQADNDMES